MFLTVQISRLPAESTVYEVESICVAFVVSCVRHRAASVCRGPEFHPDLCRRLGVCRHLRPNDGR